MKKTLVFWLRLVLGGIFVASCYDKLLNPEAFAKLVYNYQLLPDGLVNFTALTLPWFELLLGLCLLFGFWLPGAVFCANGLLSVFFLSLVFNLARGIDVHCGCFSTSSQGPPQTAYYLARDAVFLVLSWYVFVKTFFKGRFNAAV